MRLRRVLPLVLGMLVVWGWSVSIAAAFETLQRPETLDAEPLTFMYQLSMESGALTPIASPGDGAVTISPHGGLVFKTSPFSMYLVRCPDAHGETLRSARWRSESSAFVFEDVSRFEGADALLFVQQTAGWQVFQSAGRTLNRCTLRKVSPHWGEEHLQRLVGRAADNPAFLKSLLRNLRMRLHTIDTAATTAAQSPADVEHMSPGDREAVALLLSQWTEGPLELRDLTENQPLHDLKPEWEAAFVDAAGWKQQIDPGFVRVTFWPAYTQDVRSAEACVTVFLDGTQTGTHCFPSGRAVPDQVSPGAPVFSLTHANSSIIGAPVEFRLGLDAGHEVHLLWNTEGWHKVQHAYPVWGYCRGGIMGSKPMIAVTDIPKHEETMGPPLRRSLVAPALLADNMDLWGNSLATRKTLQRYGDTTQWRPLMPRRDETGALPRRRLVFNPIDLETIGMYGLPEAEDIFVWSPVAASGEAMPMPFGPGTAQMLSLVATRTSAGPDVCRFTIQQQQYGIPLWNTEEEAHFFTNSETAPVLTPGSDSCRVWLRSSLAELEPTEVHSASSRERLYRLEPQGTMVFDVPGPDVSGFVQMRVLPQVKGVPVPLEYNCGDGIRRVTVMDPAWSGSRTARMTDAIAPGDTELVMYNPSNMVVWVSASLRTPKESESPGDPYALIPPVIVEEMNSISAMTADRKAMIAAIDQLTRSLQRTSDTSALYRLLTQRARWFLAAGMFGDARDDLFVASSLPAAQGEGKYELWLLTEAYGNLKRYIPVFAQEAAVVPISRDVIPLDGGQQDMRSPSAAMLAALENEDNYDALWSWWHTVRDADPGETARVLLYGRAVQHRDWLMAADLINAVRRNHKPSLFLDVLWLRLLAAAHGSGQMVDYAQSMEASARAMELEGQFGAPLAGLNAALSRSSSWRRLKGFKGVASVVSLPQVDIKSVSTPVIKEVKDVLMGDQWHKRQTINLSQNAYRVVDISGVRRMSLRVQARWKLRPLADGSTPHCMVQLRGAASQRMDISSPESWLLRGEAFSKEIPIGPRNGAFSVRMFCQEPQAAAGVQLRLWTSSPVSGITEPEPLPGDTKGSSGHVLGVYGTGRWNLVEKGRPATVQVQGPTVVDLQWRAVSSSKTGSGTVILTDQRGRRGTIRLPAVAKGTGASMPVALPKHGLYTLQVSAKQRLYMTARYRVPRSLLARDAVSLQKGVYQAEAPASGFAQTSRVANLGIEQSLQLWDATGSLWGAWFAATDSVEQEIGITTRRNWVTGPQLGWHSCPVEGLCYKSDVALRLRMQGNPTGALYTRLSYEAPWGTRIKAGWSGFMQPVDGALQYAHRVTVALEQRISLHPIFWMIPGLRVHYYGFTLPDVVDLDAETVDSNIYNSYNFTHFKGIMPYLNLYLRPVREIMLVSRTSIRSNTNFNLIYPDRIDSELDMYIGVAGIVFNPEASVSYRYADDLRQNAATRYTAGLWMGYSWWLSHQLRVHITGGGRYISDINTYDARAMLGVVWNFGRGVKDEAPYTPLGGVYADEAPSPYSVEVLFDER